MRYVAALVAAAAMMLAAPVLALAQTVPVAPPGAWQGFFDAALPTVATIATTIVTAGLAALWTFLRRHLEEKYVLTLQEIFVNAVKGGAGVGINLLGPEVITEVLRPNSAAVEAGVEHVKKAIPDTLKKIGVGDDKIAGAVIGWMNNMLAPAMSQPARAPTAKPSAPAAAKRK